MKISGFTIIRNGISFDYPFLESIRSALPLVDEMVINVGRGDDATLDEIEKLKRESAEQPGGTTEKIKILVTDWEIDNPEKKKGGRILSEQTNFALSHCSHDWCLYLQADEVLHEQDYPLIRTAIERAGPEIEGILFDYIHFYASYDVIQHSRSAYRREVRLVRRSSGAQSVGDAQSFRKSDGSKLSVVQSGARIFHYGWVRTPEAMKLKTFFMDQLYHGAPNPEDEKTGQPHTGDNYLYKKFWGLYSYPMTPEAHPAVMKERIQNKGWHWDLTNSPWAWNLKDLKKIPLDLIERYTGIRLFEYKSYRIVRRLTRGTS